MVSESIVSESIVGGEIVDAADLSSATTGSFVAKSFSLFNEFSAKRFSLATGVCFAGDNVN